MRTFFLILLCAAAAPAPTQVPTQDQPSGTIVVQGVRERDKEVGRFVDALTDAPVFGQLSRFNYAVCPAAVGLGEAQNRAIERRMKDVARAAAIRVDKPGCRPNALLIVAPDKADLIGQMSRKYPAYFHGTNPSDIRRMMRDPSPAAAWHVEGRVDSDGLEAQRDIDGRRITERMDTPSRVGTSSRPHFVASIVVVDRAAVTGLSLVQLADYAAMRAFARTDPRRAGRSAAPTILSAIEAPNNSLVPVTLTQWDLAFLKSLYASSPDRTATSQRNEMKRVLKRKLDDGKPDR